MGTVNLKDSLMDKIDVEDKNLDDDPLIWETESESFSDHYQRLRTLARQQVRAEGEESSGDVEVALDTEEIDISEESMQELESRVERVIQEYAR